MKINKQILATLFSLLVFSSVGYANFEKAMEIYRSGKFVEAKSAFEALAAIGERTSLFNLGVMYYRGEAVDRDPVRAYVLMKIANDEVGEEGSAKIAQSIFNSFNDSQKAEADKLFYELNPIYNIVKTKERVFPRLVDDEDCPPEVTPVKRIVPNYPRGEARSGRMGITHTEYTISPEGYPRDIVVVRSTNKTFTRTSVESIKTFLYEPPLDRKPVYGHRNNFTYQLEIGDGQVRTKALTREINKLKEAAAGGSVVAQYLYASRLNTFRYFKSYLEDMDLQYRTANKWFIKSAENGLPNAQFEIGRNMLEGRGCEVDKVNGYKWINAAAASGYSPAQRRLAQSALLKSDLSKEGATTALSWLRNAALSDDFPAKLLLAWELSTSPIKEFRNGDEALSLLDSDPGRYYDELRILETKAAAHAEVGDFKKAVKFQKRAVKLAKKLEWTIPLISERLGLYEHNESYQGSYY